MIRYMDTHRPNKLIYTCIYSKTSPEVSRYHGKAHEAGVWRTASVTPSGIRPDAGCYRSNRSFRDLCRARSMTRNVTLEAAY